ncbi:uncharacterized protein LOC142358165, partial [Convolutriloba macropyga]|uniref:uncharacterized protein LOC142358165 n=1 Tax=Convolutriloba macropyga TaxID=536237 RepID=UPI003F525EB2
MAVVLGERNNASVIAPNNGSSDYDYGGSDLANYYYFCPDSGPIFCSFIYLIFVLDLILFLVVIALNSLTLTAVYYYWELRTPRNWVIVSLAISDSLLALFQTVETFLRPFYVGWLSMVTALPQVFVLSSYLHLILLAMD